MLVEYKWCSHHGKQYGKLKQRHSYHMVHNPTPVNIQRKLTEDTCTQVFTAALFTTGEMEVNSRCP